MSDRIRKNGNPTHERDPHWEGTGLADWVDAEAYKLEPSDLPKALIPFAKRGPKALPGLLATEVVDLGNIASLLNGIEAARATDGSATLSFYDGNPVAQPGPYTITNYTPTRSLDASTATLANVADFLCTLVEDLQSLNLLG